MCEFGRKGVYGKCPDVRLLAPALRHKVAAPRLRNVWGPCETGVAMRIPSQGKKVKGHLLSSSAQEVIVFVPVG